MTHTLLLADDSITIQRVIELTLSGEDIEVISVGDGETALDRLRSERPDIVLADISMPKQNGYDVAAYMRNEPRFAHVPVLLLAGAFETVDQARIEQVGCDGVLVKPFEPQQVVARVRELLARADAARKQASSPALVTPAPVETEVPAPGTSVAHDVPLPPDGTGPDGPGTGPAGVESALAPAPAPEPAVGVWFTSESAADVPAAVAAAVDASEPDAPPSVPEAAPIEPAPSAPQPVATLPAPPAGVVSAAPPGPAGDTFDDYFGRLGSAVETSALPGRVPRVHRGAGTAFDDPWIYGDVPTLSGLLEPSSPGWPGASRFAEGAGAEARTPPRDAFAPEQPADDEDAEAGRESNAIGSFVAAAFHALLEAEQGRPRVVEPRPAPVAAPSASPPGVGPDISDELVERVTQRVIDRLVPNAAREMVASIVSNVAERLVREEIARARARDEGRQ